MDRDGEDWRQIARDASAEIIRLRDCIAELEAHVSRLKRVLECVQPTEADLDSLSTHIQRMSPDVEVWWRKLRDDAPFREAATIIIGVWEAGRIRTERVQAVLKGGA